MVDVRGTTSASGFFGDTGVDHESAYKRMVCTADTLNCFKRKINATDTKDVKGRLRQLYEDIDFIAKEIIKEECRLVEQGMGECRI